MVAALKGKAKRINFDEFLELVCPKVDQTVNKDYLQPHRQTGRPSDRLLIAQTTGKDLRRQLQRRSPHRHAAPNLRWPRDCLEREPLSTSTMGWCLPSTKSERP